MPQLEPLLEAYQFPQSSPSKLASYESFQQCAHQTYQDAALMQIHKKLAAQYPHTTITKIQANHTFSFSRKNPADIYDKNPTPQYRMTRPVQGIAIEFKCKTTTLCKLLLTTRITSAPDFNEIVFPQNCTDTLRTTIESELTKYKIPYVSITTPNPDFSLD